MSINSDGCATASCAAAVRLYALLIAAAGLIVLSAPAARECAAAESAIARNALVFYSSSTGNNYHSNEVTELLGIFLDREGVVTRYWDIEQGICPDGLFERSDIYVVCYFDSNRPVCDAICDRLLRAPAGKRIALLTVPGTSERSKPLFEKIGFVHGDYFFDRRTVKTAVLSPEISRGETPFTTEAKEDYFSVRPLPSRSDARSYVKVRGDTFETSLVLSSNDGAFIAIEKLLHEKDSVRRWMVDPHFLAKLVSGGGDRIIPDPCVVSGRRAAFVHIDGDGFNYRAKYGDRRLAGEIITEEIIERFGLPVSASLIAAEINPKDFGTPDIEKNASKMLKMENVEPGTHSWYHPFDWTKVASGMMESAEIEAEDNDQIGDLKEFNPAWAARNMSLENEIRNSADYLSGIGGKKCAVMFWTGKCNPTTEAIALCESAGLKNINGSDLRRDAEYAVYTLLRPHAVNPGGELFRFNSRYANEFILTDKWTEPFDGYRAAAEGFEKTGNPVIYTPINIYFHFYIATRLPGLDSLKEVINKVISWRPTFIFAGEWIDRVRGCMSCRITRIDPPATPSDGNAGVAGYYGDPAALKALHAFRYENSGALDTFRWDGEGYPLLGTKRGAIGYSVINGSKYIFSPPGSGEIVIVDASPDRPFISSFTGTVTSVAPGNGMNISFDAAIKSPLKLVIGSAGYPQATISVTKPGGEKLEYIARNESGKDAFEFQADLFRGKIKVSVEFTTKLDDILTRSWSFIKRFISSSTKPGLPLVLVLAMYFYFMFRRKLEKKDGEKGRK